MIWYIFKVIILSLLIILLSHHIMVYLTNILTTPKVTDYVTIPQDHYDKIASLLAVEKQSVSEPSKMIEPKIQIDRNIININENNHIDELTQFMNSLI